MKITAAELQRAFGRVRGVARREPVTITHHGRDDLVLLAAKDFVRMRGGTTNDRLDAKTLDAVSAFKGKVSSLYQVEETWLFGSRARGDFRADSDADVAVILRDPPGDFVETKLAMADLAFDVMLESGVVVQPMPIWRSAWDDPDSHSNPALIRSIRGEGIPV